MDYAAGISLPQKAPTPDVVSETGTIKTTDGAKTFYRTWVHDSEPTGLVIIQHGYSEHVGRYHHVASYLARRGYRVYAADAKGHGQSDGKRGHIDRWHRYIQDLDIIIRHAKELFPDLPTALLGHSNGGLMALRHALERPDVIDCYAVSSPFCGLPLPIPVSQKVQLKGARLLAVVTPRLSIPSGIPASRTSHVDVVVQDYIDDPLVYTTTTPRWVVETIKAQNDLKERAHLITQPFLFIVSEEDHIVDPKSAEEVYHKISSKDREFHLQPGMYHESLNEEGWEERTELIASWFDRHLKL